MLVRSAPEHVPTSALGKENLDYRSHSFFVLDHLRLLAHIAFGDVAVEGRRSGGSKRPDQIRSGVVRPELRTLLELR